MKFFIYVSLLTLLSTHLLANESAFKCNLDGNQSEMNQCAYDDALKADHELNKVYWALIKKSADDKTYIKKLRESQRIWIKFRDAELAAMFSCEGSNKMGCWGSMVGTLYPSAKEELTKERTARLKKYLEEGQNVMAGATKTTNP